MDVVTDRGILSRRHRSSTPVPDVAFVIPHTTVKTTSPPSSCFEEHGMLRVAVASET